jgi:hypothetical protein
MITMTYRELVILANSGVLAEMRSLMLPAKVASALLRVSRQVGEHIEDYNTLLQERDGDEERIAELLDVEFEMAVEPFAAEDLGDVLIREDWLDALGPVYKAD